MNARDPLTLRYARTLHEARNDPYAWFTNAKAAKAEEDGLRASFEAQDKQVETLSHKWAQRVIYAIAVGVFAAFIFGKL